jgi:hypothetical protein
MLEIVSPTGAHFWDRPSTSGTKLAAVPFGARVNRIGPARNKFEHVIYQGRIGYVAEPFVRPVDAGAISTVAFAGAGYYASTGSDVAIRSAPQISSPAFGAGSNVVGLLQLSDRFEATGEVTNGFAKGGSQKGVGWVSTLYLFAEDPAMREKAGPAPSIVPIPTPALPTPPRGVIPEPKEKIDLVEEKITKSPLLLAGGFLLLAVVIYFVAK